MHLDGAFGDGQAAGDQLVRQPLSDQLQDIPFARRQLLNIAIGTGAVFPQAGGENWRQRLAQHHLPGCRLMQRFQQILRLHIFQQIAVGAAFERADYVVFMVGHAEHHDAP